MEAFQPLYDEQCGAMETMMEQFVKWCVEDSERAKEWLVEELE